jgi:3-phenylpropionate/cinnamic acid dioxygenase small subunit
MDSLLEAAAPVVADRERIRDFYDDYYDVLDSVRLEDWPEFFAEECVYRIIPRENYERGFRLATVAAESRGMLADRVTGLMRTQVYAPRYYRRFPGPLKVRAVAAAGVHVEHNLLIIQTLIDKPSEIVLTARCHDVLVEDGARLRLKRRDVVFDSEMVPNSLIYPA